jgi:hypothetical protein
MHTFVAGRIHDLPRFPIVVISLSLLFAHVLHKDRTH